GTNWHALGNGLRNFDGPGSENGAVHALTVHQGYLFAGGSFRKAGDTEATNLACWDGVTWNTVGSGVSDALSVLTLAPNGSDLYAGGAFRSIGGVGANRLARWDGLAWFPLGSGIGGQLGDGPLSLATSGTEL